MTDTRSVAITGIGPVTPIGTGLETFWENAKAGCSGVGAISRFDTDGFPVTIAAEVRDFDPSVYLSPRRARRADRFAQFAFAAAALAVEDAKYDLTKLRGERTGIVVGTTYAGLGRYEQEHKVLLASGARAIAPEVSMMVMPMAASALLAIEFGITGPNECIGTACAAGGHSLSRGFDLIRSGIVDVVLAGGAEAPITPLAIASFAATRALSTRNEEPTRASRPFDADRDGFVFGEGATVLILEEMKSALSRGAHVYAEVLGYGHTADAYNLASPDPSGAGAAAAMRAALRSAGLDASAVDHINAHAASTPLGDTSEAMAIRTVFGAHPPPTSATKSMTGHLVGAAGTTEAALTALALDEGMLPPTINFEHPDAHCDLDVVANVAVRRPIEIALSNSFALGGLNCSLAFARVS